MGYATLEESIVFGVELCLAWQNSKVIRSFGRKKKKNILPPTHHPLFLHTLEQTLLFLRFINSIKPVLGSLVIMGRSV